MVRAELDVGQNLHRHLRTNGEHDHVAAVQYGLIGCCDRNVGKLSGEGGSHFRIARRDQDAVPSGVRSVQSGHDGRGDRPAGAMDGRSLTPRINSQNMNGSSPK